MKIVKRCENIVYLRNVSYEDRDILVLFGGKERHDLDYRDTFTDSRSPWAQQVEAFELPSGIKEKTETTVCQTNTVDPAYVAVFMNEEPFCYGEDTAICLAVNRQSLEKVNVDDVNAFLEQFGLCNASTRVWKFEEISAEDADRDFHGKGAQCGSFFFPTRDQWTVVDFEHIPEGELIYGQP